MNARLLGEDLGLLFDEWQGNTLRSSSQAGRWNAKRLNHGWFGNDGDSPLLLLEEDGWDGMPVGEYTSSSAKRFFHYGNDHVWPSARDLTRLGVFLHLDLYRTLALALKMQWEKFVACQLGGPAKADGRILGVLLVDEERRRQYGPSFRPDATEIQNAFFAHRDLGIAGDCDLEKYPLVNQVGAYTPASFSALVQDMLLAGWHFRENDSSELRKFGETAWRAAVELQGANQPQEEAFMAAKCNWQELQQQLGEILLLLEDRRLFNANVRAKWFNIYGALFIDMQEQADRCCLFRRKIHLRKTTDLSAEQIDEEVAREQDIRTRKLREMEVLAWAWEQGAGRSAIAGTPMDEQAFAGHMAKCKRVLREIYLLLSPDRLDNNPVSSKLTQAQREQLKKIWLKVMAVRPKEIGWAADFLSHDHRILEVLVQIRDDVKAILASAGIETPPRLIVQGETVDEQMRWYKREIARLDLEIEDLRAELKVLVEDPDVREKEALNNGPDDKREEVMAQMRNHTTKCREEADRLENDLRQLQATPRSDASAGKASRVPARGMAGKTGIARKARSKRRADGNHR